MKYPKLLGFVIAVILAYILFSNPPVISFVSHIGEFGYLGTVIAGMFYTFGFTSPFPTGFFIDLNPSNIWIAGILGGIGAFAGDMFIFKFARFSFKDEFEKLRKEKLIRVIGGELNSPVLYLIAAILIASPLPDEAGITILAGMTKLKAYEIAIISIVFNTFGILILLSL